MSLHLQRLKSAMLPIAMVVGAVGYKWMGSLTFLSPYLIFAMLFITYCKLTPRDFKPTKHHLLLLGIQMLLSAGAFFAINSFSHSVAEGVFLCFFIPTATAAPVITSMLGGSISFVASFSLVSNLFVALVGPVVLAAVGEHPEITLWQSTLLIMRMVAPVLVGPIVLAFAVRRFFPPLHRAIMGHQQLSFYIWAISLVIIVGSCVSFIISHWHPSEVPGMLWMIAGALAACLIQFVIGRKLGSRWKGEGDMRVSVAQGLMQKNTVLGVWVALTYMNPLASVGPAAYIAWQNILNSWQIWRMERRKGSEK